MTTACARSRMHTGFAGKSKGHLGEGQHDTVLGGGHGGPVPAKLTQTAKEMGRVGKRPTPVGTTRCTLRCPHPFPKLVRNNSSLGLLLSILQSQFPCFALMRVSFASKGVLMRTQFTIWIHYSTSAILSQGLLSLF